MRHSYQKSISDVLIRLMNAQENLFPPVKTFKEETRPVQVLFEEIGECKSFCETEKSADLCSRTEDIFADCILVQPVLPCTVQTTNTVTLEGQLQAPANNRVHFLSEPSTHESQQNSPKYIIQAVCSSNSSCSEILIPDVIQVPDVRPALDIDEVHGRESTVQVSEVSITVAPGDVGKGSSCVLKTCSVLSLCHYLKTPGTSQNAIDITPSLNFGYQHLSAQWDPAAEFPALT